MSDEVLRLRGVGIRHERSMLLRDVDWTVRSDESWVIIGPNGAGKTTLLQIAGAMLFPTEGSVEILGEAVEDAKISHLRPGIGLPRSAVADRVPPAEKVIDLVLTASYGILGRTAEDYDSFDVTRAVELLDALGCAHLIRRSFATLSEGERKRVQIARSLMPDPELRGPPGCRGPGGPGDRARRAPGLTLGCRPGLPYDQNHARIMCAQLRRLRSSPQASLQAASTPLSAPDRSLRSRRCWRSASRRWSPTCRTMSAWSPATSVAPSATGGSWRASAAGWSG